MPSQVQVLVGSHHTFCAVHGTHHALQLLVVATCVCALWAGAALKPANPAVSVSLCLPQLMLDLIVCRQLFNLNARQVQRTASVSCPRPSESTERQWRLLFVQVFLEHGRADCAQIQGDMAHWGHVPGEKASVSISLMPVDL